MSWKKKMLTLAVAKDCNPSKRGPLKMVTLTVAKDCNASKRGPPLTIFDDSDEESNTTIPSLRSSSEIYTVERDKGNSLALLGRFSEARTAFSAAARGDPERAGLYFEAIAQTYLVESDWFNAVRCAKTALIHSPNYHLAHLALARALFNFGEIDLAVDEFSIALKYPWDSANYAAIEAEKSEAENWQDSLQIVRCPTQFNSRWYGDIHFYGTGLTIDHSFDEAWNHVSTKNRSFCCISEDLD